MTDLRPVPATNEFTPDEERAMRHPMPDPYEQLPLSNNIEDRTHEPQTEEYTERDAMQRAVRQVGSHLRGRT